MEISDFIFGAQQVKPDALVTLQIDPVKSSLLVQWCWGSDKDFSRSILLKELNYDEAINVFFAHCKAAMTR
ncbi:hypothetical protein [Pragia fontium]|uniref:hypothetical protein n=1 Tax=Pragia fontium TaxID=82985 RepID=UPI000F6D1034|nr:hypothetical protein [Pragia fontium]VEJ55023.1 Uncharacterised protein [Pragia fontium]